MIGVRKSMAAAGSAGFLIAAPGTVAGLIPWWISGWVIRRPLVYWWPARVVGVILVVAGITVLLQAFARFVTEGRGTPAPVAAPDRLVIGGLFGYVRNPMYVAIIAIICGEALVLWNPILFGYGVVVWGLFEIFVTQYEQPVLRARFGSEYERYCRNVRPWLPRPRPWRGAA